MKLRTAVLLLGLGLNGCLTTPVPPSPPGHRPSALTPARRKAAPVSLTASDGTGLELVSLNAHTTIDGPLAFTELHLTFQNPQSRVLEGHFEITLPEGAAVSRMAMKLSRGWQEAEVVELQAARVAYEDFLHRRQDPALLEKQAGNSFGARVFPIPANGQKEIVLSYSQELTPHQTYVLPLAGLPRIHQLNVTALVTEDPRRDPYTLRLDRRDELPDGDFTIDRRSPVLGLVNDRMAVMTVSPAVSDQKASLDNLLVLVDTSASRAAGYEAEVDLVESLVEQLPASTHIQVAAFDQEVRSLYTGQARGFKASALREREPLGATDLEAALAWAGKQSGFDRVLLVSDGVGTEGAAPRVPALKRLDVLAVGGIRDSEVAARLAHGCNGVVLDGDRPAPELARELQLQAASGVNVTVPGASWVWPDRLDGLQSGQDALVYAYFDKPVTKATVALSGGLKQTVEVPLSSVVEPLLKRAGARADIARLSRKLAAAPEKEQEGIRKEIIEVSTKNRVLSDLTAMLVLETRDDYARFHIDRASLSDIMSVNPDTNKLEMISRRELPDFDTVPRTRTEMAEPLSSSPAPSRAVYDGSVKMQPRRLAAATSMGSGADYESVRKATAIDSTDSAVVRQAEREPALLDESAVPTRAQAPPRDENDRPRIRRSYFQSSEPMPTGVEPYSGKMAQIQSDLKAGRVSDALAAAWSWHREEPGDLVALVALGESLKAHGEPEQAARAYGSIIDLYPSRADLRRYAGSRLEELGAIGQRLAVDDFRKAEEQRPDHPSSHRLLGYALVRDHDLPGAFKALEEGASRDYPEDRFRGCRQILVEDLGLVGAVWAAQDPRQRSAIEKRLREAGSEFPTGPSTRFVLTWETDDNDVDFHIQDGQGNHAFYQNPELASGGRLYADVTTGYGPECFNIPGIPQAFPYHLMIHYYSRGPMGYGMGKVEIVQYDGKGKLSFDERPYLVMNDHAAVDLGYLKKPLAD